MFALLKRKPKPQKPGREPKAESREPAAALDPRRSPLDSASPLAHRPEANGHPSTLGPRPSTPQLLRARHVIALLGITKRDLNKFVECSLLTPRYLPNPHRLGGRNVKKHQRAWFLATEVQAIITKLNPRPQT